MFCSKCGAQNNENNKFCTNCGEALVNNNQVNNEPGINNKNIAANEAGIRKAIKEKAKKEPKGIFVTACLIFYGIIIAFFIILPMYNAFNSTNNNSLGESFGIIIVAFLFLIITGILIQMFNYGLTSEIINVSRKKQATLSNIFQSPFKNFKNTLMVIVAFIIYNIVFSISSIIPIASAFLPLIIAIYYYPALDIMLYMYADEEKDKASLTDMFKQSLDIIKGHRVEYYGMIFSFIGWFLLAPLTLGIIYIWVFPYIKLAKANMYLRWIGEENFDKEASGLNNGTIIGLTIGGYFVSIIIFIIIIFAFVFALGDGLSSYSEDIMEKDYGEVYNEIESDKNDIPNEIKIGENNNSVTFIVPDGVSNYNKIGDSYYLTSYSADWLGITYGYYNYESAENAYQNALVAEPTSKGFTIEINNKTVNCLDSTTKDYNVYDIFYPVDSNSYINIHLTSYEPNTISQSDITKYIKTK